MSDLIQYFETMGDSLSHLWSVGAFLVIVYGLVKRVTKRIVGQIVTEVEGVVETKIEPVRAEVMYNGGGSMKDAVRRLEEGQANIHARLDSGNVTLKALSAQAGRNEGRLQAVTTNLPAAYYEMDSAGNVTSVNDSYLALFQLSEQEALNSQEWRNSVSERDLVNIDRSGAQAMQSQKDWYCTFTVKRKGVDIPVVVRAKALFIDGEFSGYSGAMTYDLDLIK